MNRQEKKDTSPFAEMSFQAQQDKWREWRSRQWNFRDAEENNEEAQAQKEPTLQAVPLRPASTHHRELDRVLSRHLTAVRKAGAFCRVTGDDPVHKG